MNDQPIRPSILVIGVGNEFRSDDAAGLLAARSIRANAKEEATVLEHHREVTGLMDRWTCNDIVYLIDAVSSGSAPGTVIRRNLTDAPIVDIPFRHSTHSISIADAVEFGRMFGTLPHRLVFFGIEGGNFSTGQSVSPEVDAAIQRVAKQVCHEIEELSHTHAQEDSHA